MTIDASTEASLQMDSAPASPVDATTVYASMFQMNAVALRAERYITWKRVGTNTVKYLTATAWPSPTGGTVLQRRGERQDARSTKPMLSYPLRIYRGDTYRWRFMLWADPDRTVAVDLTGVVVGAEIRCGTGHDAHLSARRSP